MHDIASARDRGDQRVIATHAGVAEHAALFGQPVGLTDRRVDIHRDRFVARSGARRPCPSEELAADPVELTDMSPRKGPQERAQRRRGQHPMAQHRFRLTRTERVGVVDAVAARERGVDQRHCLVPDIRSAGRIAQIDRVVDQLPELELLRQRGRQHQSPRRPPHAHHRRSHQHGRDCAKIASRRCPPESGRYWCRNRHHPYSEGILRGYAHPHTKRIGGSGLRRRHGRGGFACPPLRTVARSQELPALEQLG